jgi:hypothetical protein
MMSDPEPSATCRCGYRLLPGQRCPECGQEYSDAVARVKTPVQIRLHIIHLLCIIGCIPAIGIICWLDPGSGLRFLVPELLSETLRGYISPVPVLLVAAPFIVLICSSAVTRRAVRIITAIAGTTWLLSWVLFAALLAARDDFAQVLIVLVSAGPFLTLLCVSLVLSTRPGRTVALPAAFRSALLGKVMNLLFPRPGASARVKWFCLAFWLLVFILICAVAWLGLTDEPLLLAPRILWIGLFAAPVLVVFMIGMWLVGKRSDG